MNNEMVKMAYDEICGFDKEAGIHSWSDNKLERRKRKLEDKTSGGYYDAVNKGRRSLGVGPLIGGGNASNTYLKNKAKLDSINDELARRQPSMAEKAAAYYDEAQYAKEAALSDYDEACAYEAAALEVLDELGYLD